MFGLANATISASLVYSPGSLPCVSMFSGSARCRLYCVAAHTANLPNAFANDRVAYATELLRARALQLLLAWAR